MTKEETYELLGKYLRGELGGVERKALEARLEADPELQKELELHRGLHQAVGDKRLDYFRELVKESEQRYFDRPAQPQTSTRALYTKVTAAAVTLLLGIALAYWALSPTSSPRGLFAEYFEPYQSPGTFRSEDLTTLDQNFILGLSRYDEQQYAEAIGYFSKALERDPDKSLALFLRGVSALAIDKLSLAEQDLKAVMANEESLFSEQAKWYLALLYLKQERVELTKGLLQEIEVFSSNQPNELLEEL